MKRTTILLGLLFAVTCVFAQKGKVTSALTYKEAGNLEKAVAAIEEAIDPANPKTKGSIDWPTTWEARGEIYQAVFKSKDENVKKLSADPLTTAYESYMKAVALEEKGKGSKSVKIKLLILVADLTSQAYNSFNEKKYEKAQQSFEQILAIEQTPFFKEDDPTAVDTVSIYNAGLAAYHAQNYDKAIQYYREAAKYNYSGANIYQLISSSYMQKKDTVGASDVLQEGLKKYPDDPTILIEVFNILLNSKKYDEALKYLDIVISKDPKNATYFFARGALYDKLDNTDAATESYLKAIEFKDDYFDAYYNLGAVYYNKGVKQIDVANAVPSNQAAKYEEEKEKADVEFRKAIPYMEKAHTINPTDKFALESLKNLYYRSKMMDKHAEVVEKMKDL